MGDKDEYEYKKKAIFDAMGKRGQERILRIGYENWEPFQEPKDPRERIFGGASVRASMLVKEFSAASRIGEESVADQKEIFELCRGLLQDEPRAKAIFEFCKWYGSRQE